MSITDELREWAKTLTHWWYDPVKDEYTYTTGIMPPSIDAIRLDSNIIAIADRIDAEHEAKVSYWQGASYKDGYDEGFASADDWLAQHEDAMAEHGWIRLPKDADGVPIHVGDVMEWVRHRDDDPTIVRKVSAVGVGTFLAWSDGLDRYAQYEAHAYRHYHAPTVEDVLTEFGIDWEHENDCEDRAALLKEYAAKLRLVEEDA